MEPQPFDRHAVTAFRYVGWHHNPSSGEVVLRYALDDLCLQEIYSFPVPAEPLSPARRAVVDRLLGHLFLAAGLSYYKCAAPDRVVVEAGSFSAADLAYHRLLLAKGLGEFSWANGLDPRPCTALRPRAGRAAGRSSACDRVESRERPARTGRRG